MDSKRSTPNPKASQEQSNKKQKKPKNPLVYLFINILGMIILGLLMAGMTLFGLKYYTKHNESVQTPNVYDLSVAEAEAILKDHHLQLEVVDSIFVEEKAPGVIIETTPKKGSIIKQGRTIFAVINAFHTKQVKVPEVFEVSRRQAEALLRRSGFTNISIKMIPGMYDNLAIQLRSSDGAVLRSGDRVDYNSHLTLEVTSSILYRDSIALTASDSLALDSLTSPLLEEPAVRTQSPAMPNDPGKDLDEEFFWSPITHLLYT